jgi:hypothetical protein
MNGKCKPIPGFSNTELKPGKIDANGTKQNEKSQPLVSDKGGKGGMPQGGMIPSKV